MKEIELKAWTAKDQDGKEVQETILNVISVIVNLSMSDLPKGLEQFRLFQRLTKAMEEAETTKVLKLEDKDYDVIKNLVEKNVPSQWAFQKPIVEAIEDFLSK